jgi:nitrogen regulatory protein P-II 1
MPPYTGFALCPFQGYSKAVKRIEAVIQPFKLDDVKAALSRIGLEGLTAIEVRGFGRQKGHTESYRGAEYTIDLVPKLKIEIVVPDHHVDAALEAVLAAARTGQIGDGKIFVVDIPEAVRIRTGERGNSAV